MALKAKIRLSDPEEILSFMRGVDAMAANAAYITLAVSGALKHHVSARVAFQTAIVYLPGSGFNGVEDL